MSARRLKSTVMCLAALLLCIPWAGQSEESEKIERLSDEIQKIRAQIDELESLKERLLRLEAELAEMQKTGVPDKEEVALAEEREQNLGTVEIGETKLKFGGAVRFNYAYRDFTKSSRSKYGDLEFDIFRINFEGRYKKLLASAEYRFYSFQNVIHHGWIGYDFNEDLQGQVGVIQVPFGLLPYASHNWWFGVPYYVGLEDDYDLGLKMIKEADPWQFQFAFFKNAEWGDATRTKRYSFDVLRALGHENEETNQLNLRLAYTQEYKSGRAEFGISGQVGQLYNASEDGFGYHWAAAAHLNAYWGPWNLMLEAARYEYDPDNPPSESDGTVVMGAFDTVFPVAARGNLFVANLSYDLLLEWGPIAKLTFYNDYSILVKDNEDFDDTQINTLGCLISAPPVYTYIDLIFGRNAPFLGLPKNIEGIPFGLAPGEEDAEWETRFNINVGYYF